MASDEYCSGDNKEYKLIYTPDFGVTLISPKGSQHFESAGSAGSGLNGRIYADKSKNETIKILSTTIEMDSNPGWEKTDPIEIVKDRVYWPCEE